MKLLALIPARGGSKGIPGKNVVDLAGKPLIAWTLEAARTSRYELDVLVSTDDEQIAAVAAQWGGATDYRRPAELASDTAPTLDAVQHAVQWLAGQGRHHDALVLLQPTSPLRTAAHLDAAIDLWLQQPDQPVVSVCPPAHPPYLTFAHQPDGRWQRLAPLPASGRRQDSTAPYVQINGAIYIQSLTRLSQGLGLFEEDNTRFYVMPTQASVDIDTPLDLALVQLLLGQPHLLE